jgi:hypothetical protein
LQPAISQRKHNPKHHDRINSTKTTCGKANPKPDATIVLANDLAPGHSGGGDKPRRFALFASPGRTKATAVNTNQDEAASSILPTSGCPEPVLLSPRFADHCRFGTSSVATADFNLDGRLDLVAGNESSNNLSVLLGNGSGGFSRRPVPR